jgi:general secretion pathway protein K
MLKADERGVALLLALLVLTILTALILEFDAEARREYRAAAAFRDDYKAGMLTRAAVQAARAVLLQDLMRERMTGQKFDGPTDIWAMPIKNFAIGDGFLTAQIQDETGKFNLNNLASTSGGDIEQKKKVTRAKRLFELLRVNPNLVDALIDWMDQDEVPQPAGAESLYYQSLKPPYRSANSPLPGLGDLRLIKGFTTEIIERITPYVTVFPIEGGAPMNINTADPIVLQTLDPSVTQTVAMEIVQGRPYKTKVELDRVGSFQEIGKVLRAANDYDIKSDYFSARLAVTVNETTKTAWVVLKRDAGKGESTVEYLRML